MREFSRAATRILVRMGQDAFLRGTEPCKVHVERGVEVTGTYGEVVGTRDIATMLSSMAPKPGDTLDVGTLDDTGLVLLNPIAWLVDTPPFNDTGYTCRSVLRRP
jgi:hypothetical protein